MNYIIFDNQIYYEAKGKYGVSGKDEINSCFPGDNKDFTIALIDTLQKTIPAPEKDSLKKDQALSAAFDSEYVIQSEQIGKNLFQVIGIEKEKLNEIYKAFGLAHVNLVVPYAIALREFLKKNNLAFDGKRLVFLDDLGSQVLLTIFNGLLFTTPRRMPITLNRLVTELKRSQENYRSLNKDEKIEFIIVTNSKGVQQEIIKSGFEKEQNLVLLEETYPALSGLKTGKFFMHYLLPEEIIRLRKINNLKNRLKSLLLTVSILFTALVILFSSLVMKNNAQTYLNKLEVLERHKLLGLEETYARKYKDIIKKKKKPDFTQLIDSLVNALPRDYKIESVTLKNNPDSSRFEAIVYLESKDRPLAPLILPEIFKKARLENIFVKDNPGVRIILDI